MTHDQLDQLRCRFRAYCRSFDMPSPDDRRNLLLKEIHTEKVCENMAIIAAEVLDDPCRFALAGAVALFHDVGRFSQYRDHRTFKDSESVNHAALGARILADGELLEGVDEFERRVIVEAVRLHNVYELPRLIAPDVLPFLRLVRDADKLDIWRVFIDYFAAPVPCRASAAGLGLPDEPTCSDDVINEISAGRMVRLDMLKTLNDFKLLQMSWAYDLNTIAAARLAVEREYLPQLAQTLPECAKVRAAVETVEKYINQRLSSQGRSTAGGQNYGW